MPIEQTKSPQLNQIEEFCFHFSSYFTSTSSVSSFFILLIIRFCSSCSLSLAPYIFCLFFSSFFFVTFPIVNEIVLYTLQIEDFAMYWWWRVCTETEIHPSAEWIRLLQLAQFESIKLVGQIITFLVEDFLGEQKNGHYHTPFNGQWHIRSKIAAHPLFNKFSSAGSFNISFSLRFCRYSLKILRNINDSDERQRHKQHPHKLMMSFRF